MPPTISHAPKTTAQEGYKEMDKDKADSLLATILVLFLSIIFTTVAFISDQSNQSERRTWGKLTADVYLVNEVPCGRTHDCKRVWYQYTVNGDVHRGSFLEQKLDYSEGDPLTVEYRNEIPSINRLPEEEIEPSKSSKSESAQFIFIFGVFLLALISLIYEFSSDHESQRV